MVLMLFKSTPDVVAFFAIIVVEGVSALPMLLVLVCVGSDRGVGPSDS